jgi:large subunit ribosomal protein L18
MKGNKTPRAARKRRHIRLRKVIAGTTAQPRLAVFRSLTHIYAQVINDAEGRTLAAASTLEKPLKGVTGNKTQRAKAVGAAIAEKAREAGVTKVVFDRGGNRFHGRVKALAEAAREGGLQF